MDHIMEKYCKSCGRVFNDLKFKLCPFCGAELNTRHGRQHIPRKLRHEVFKRDGYRCRECGASKDETSLEIDHIVPVARGGTNDIDNLQTLCRECNRMKLTDTWVGGSTDLKAAQNELRNLEKQLQDAEVGLENAVSEDDEINYQFKILRSKENIEIVKNKIEMLKQKEASEIAYQNEIKKQQQLFKRLYVKLDDDSISFLSSYYKEKNKNNLIKILVNDFDSENEIFKFIKLSTSDEYKKCPICNLIQDSSNNYCINCDYDFVNKRVRRKYRKAREIEPKEFKAYPSRRSLLRRLFK